MCCSVLQCVAGCVYVRLQHAARLQQCVLQSCVYVCMYVRLVVCCSVLQRVAVCCIVLQCVCMFVCKTCTNITICIHSSPFHPHHCNTHCCSLAACCSLTYTHTATHCNTLQHISRLFIHIMSLQTHQIPCVYIHTQNTRSVDTCTCVCVCMYVRCVQI